MPRQAPRRGRPAPQKPSQTPSGGGVEMQPVQSSNLAAIGYDAEMQELYVQFKGSGTYKYDGVPINVYNDLMSASSHGKYFSANIRNSYPFTKI